MRGLMRPPIASSPELQLVRWEVEDWSGRSGGTYAARRLNRPPCCVFTTV